MSSIDYANEKLSQLAADLVAEPDHRKTLCAARMTLTISLTMSMPLPERCVGSVLTFLQSCGLEHEDFSVPIPSPLALEELPDSRVRQIAGQALSACLDVREAFVEQRLGQSSQVATGANYRWLRYAHLAWPKHEHSADYLAFLRAALPNFPEDVLAQWIARHPDVLRHGNAQPFDLARLCFTRETWASERLDGICAHNSSYVMVGDGSTGDGYLREHREYPHDWLASRVVVAGTWPVPPIVLRDGGHAPEALDHAVEGLPYLLEGHRRAALVLNLIGQGKAAANHDVWVVDVQSAN